MDNLGFKLLDELAKVTIKAYEESKCLKNKINYKELNDIVTATDSYIENKVIEFIKFNFPEHSIYSEEGGSKDLINSKYKWLIDPIDGTINFAADLPLFTSSIALMSDKQIILGLIIDYSRNDIYSCIKGKGAYLNGEKISVSDCDRLNDSIVSFCLTSHYSYKYIIDTIKVEERLAPHVRGLRLIVSTALELAWCACGKIDGVLNVKPSIGLSSAAGKLLVKEAGGYVTNLQGKKRKDVDTMLVTNGKIHNQIIEKI